MKISKIFVGLALVCSMGGALASTVTVTSGSGSSYTFLDGATAIATLEFTTSDGKLSYSFTESSSYLGDATSLLLTYTNGGTNFVNQTIALTTGVDALASTKLGGAGASFKSATLTYTPAVTPVPEPESYAMMLAGLGLMGAIARRRNKSKTA